MAERARGDGGDIELGTISGAVEEPDDEPLSVERRKLCMPCIVIPCLVISWAVVLILSVMLRKAAVPATARPPFRILFVGNSFTYGPAPYDQPRKVCILAHMRACMHASS